MKKVLFITLLSIIALSPVLACNEDENLQPPASKPGISSVTGSNVQVTVTPVVAYLVYGASTTFSARVTGATDKSVTWSIKEGFAGGTITAAGVYTAPPKDGLYVVVATSRADRSKTACAMVDVKAPSSSAVDNLTLLQKTTGVGGSVTYQVTTQETDKEGKSTFSTGDSTIHIDSPKIIWSGRAFSGKYENTSLYTIEVTGMVSPDGNTLTSFKYLEQKKSYRDGDKQSITKRVALANVPLNRDLILEFYFEQIGIAVGRYVMAFESEYSFYDAGHNDRGKIVGAGTNSSKCIDQKASAKSYLLVKFKR